MSAAAAAARPRTRPVSAPRMLWPPVRCVSHTAASTPFQAEHHTAQSAQSHEHPCSRRIAISQSAAGLTPSPPALPDRDPRGRWLL